MAADTTQPGGELQRLSDATRALAEVSTASGAWELARTAEAARRYAQMKGLGHEAVNYATGIKAKAMILLADFVDDGQREGTVAKPGAAGRGRTIDVSDENIYSLPELLGETDSNKARQAVFQARSLRDALGGTDQVDQLVKQANDSGDDLGIRGLKRMAAEQREPAPVAEPVPFPEGKYRALVIDPPWPIEKIGRDERPNQGQTLDYPVMSLADIAALPVPDLAADGCHVYLWTTHRFLPDAFAFFDGWGVRYQCLMTWVKNVGITPFSWMYDTEHVLFGRIGSLQLEQMGLRLSFNAAVTRHSEKPDVFYERVLAASPEPRLELFARTRRDGFEAWGNEVSNEAV